TCSTMGSLAEANTNFTVDLLKRMEEEQSKNIFFSPFSISAALAMTCFGARVLHFDKITGSRMSKSLP
ncbi:hypothetical protein E2320_011051, partial [Naja naja]